MGFATQITRCIIVPEAVQSQADPHEPTQAFQLHQAPA